MRDAQLISLAGRQFNRVSRAQILELGYSDHTIGRRVAGGRLVVVEEAVFAFPPVLDDDWGSWMGATLTDPGTFLSHESGATAWGYWDRPRPYETVTRPGSGGPRRHGSLMVHRSSTLEDDTTVLRGIPITTPARTLLDLAAHYPQRTVARALREAIRLTPLTADQMADVLGRHRRRRGCAKLRRALASYMGLPIERARSGAEVRALELLRDAGRPMPRLNVRIAGEEADLSWSAPRLIVEIDGRPFHLDAGEDARRQAVWEAAGWTVRRISSDDVYERPHRLLALAP